MKKTAHSREGLGGGGGGGEGEGGRGETFLSFLGVCGGFLFVLFRFFVFVFVCYLCSRLYFVLPLHTTITIPRAYTSIWRVIHPHVQILWSHSLSELISNI